MEGSQGLDEASAHPCLSGSQISWCFPAGKTQHWGSHCQNCSGKSVAYSWCFIVPLIHQNIMGCYYEHLKSQKYLLFGSLLLQSYPVKM